MRELLHHGF
jgi:tyrosinase